ncbi:diacylglycerol kinase family protein [Crossiella sp. CA-258035]|uniref:diacylglycerol kinase family protein n=1 Tax=Crossiella sp. CA-258035 TaxID=2981138 RepID=UPI0024BC3975|nr:diacylglycerol kinase family protein [Crossiella sp. CA-258035]WHT16826.1 diacylglycerol kinase family protein [Crossiella sp. CA-258035]
MTRLALLVSPASGAWSAARVAGSVAAALRPAVTELVPLVAGSGEHLAELARAAVAAGVDVLAVLGGDGAAHAAVQACAGSGTALAVIPAGTGNDLAAAVGLPRGSREAAAAVAEALRGGSRRTLDLGRIAGGGYFATVLCAGFDAAVNERTNRMRWPRGPRRYDLAILAELAGLRPRQLLLETTAGRVEVEATLVALGNTTSYGGGIPICPDADPADGELDVTVVGAASRRLLLRILPTLRTGRHVDHPVVRTFRARKVQLSGDNGWVAYADGERQARLPVTVRAVPGALTVVAGAGR